MNTLVSVVLPCYNASNFVEEAVRSVMEQTYKNLEIIVIDDCSTDNTLTILQRLAAEDKRVKVVCNERNLKLVATLNKGIGVASGKYIARMDADDISTPDRIEKQLKFLEANQDIGMCGCNYIIIDNNGNKTGKVQFPADSDLLKAELLFFSPFAHPGVMIRKVVFDDVGLYKEGLVPAEDYELWIRISAKYLTANISQFLLQYRWHGGNISATKKHEQENAMMEIFQIHLGDFGFADSFLHYHLKFLTGEWYKKSSASEIKGFSRWKKQLFELNKSRRHFDEFALRKTFTKYASLAYLSILKSSSNSLMIKAAAFRRLLLLNPLISIRHLISRGL